MEMDSHLQMMTAPPETRPMHAPRRSLAILLLFGLVAAGTIRSGAQEQLASHDELDRGFYKSNTLFAKFVRGQQAPNKGDKDALDAMAKWLVYRFVSTPPHTAKDMGRLRDQFDQQL